MFQVTKSGIVEAVLTWAKSKAEQDLQKHCSSKKQNKLKGYMLIFKLLLRALIAILRMLEGFLLH
jgi:hypothetical protein